MIECPSTPEKPVSIAQLADQCVQCGLCLPHCPTYQLDRHEAESPRGRIAYMKAVSTQQLQRSEKGELHLHHCLGCRRCEAACPAEVPYGELLELSQVDSYQQQVPPFLDRFYSKALARPSLLKLLLPLARVAHRLPILPNHAISRLPVKKHLQNVAIFEGCVAKTYEQATRSSLTQLLNHCDIGVIDSPAQNCCGAAAIHQGDQKTRAALTMQNRQAFAKNTPVISLASGCHEALSQSLSEHTTVIDACDFLAQQRNKLHFKAANTCVVLHIPCTQSSVVKSTHSLRTLLGMVPNLNIIELPDHGCCGAAGMHMLRYPERAQAMRNPLIEMIEKTQASQILSANIGCRLHIANACKLNIRHPVDFLAEHLS
jgi:glycolate oxidase iron-sulfur subunit